MDKRTVIITSAVSVLLHIGVLSYVAMSWGVVASRFEEPEETVLAVVPPPPPPPPPPPEVEQLVTEKPRFRPRPVAPPPVAAKKPAPVPLKPQPPAVTTADATMITTPEPVPDTPAPPVSRAPPRAASKPPPTYPRRALEAEKEGVVHIRITIQADGAVSEAAVISARPEGWFETAALAAVKQWRYEASGRVSTAQVEVEFKLQ